MFYSVDLLSLKGGRMNIIWLLGMQRLYHRESSVALTFTYQGQERADQEKEGGTSQSGSKGPMQGACEEVVSTIITIRHLLLSRFPVQGKEKSFSLRMSATLVYGVCINLRVQCEELRRSTQNLLSLKAVSVDTQAIDLPTVPTSAHVTR